MGIKLSAAERLILFFAEHQHDISVKQLATKLRVREHVVRHAFRNLQRNGLIRPEVSVDHSKLGWISACLHFSVQSRGTNSRTRLIQMLIDSPRTTWLAETGGSYQFETTILARNQIEVSTFVDGMSEIAGVSFSKKALAFETDFLNFGSKFLIQSTEPAHEPSALNRSWEQIPIDELDHKILWAMCNTEYTCLAHVARTIGISNTTLEFRVKRLESRGIINRRVLVIDHSRYGAHFFYIFLSVNGHSADLRNRLVSFCRGHPSISTLIRALGAYDYQLIITVEDIDDALAVSKCLEQTFEGELTELLLVPRFRALKHRSYPCHPDWSRQNLLFLDERPLSPEPEAAQTYMIKHAG